MDGEQVRDLSRPVLLGYIGRRPAPQAQANGLLAEQATPGIEGVRYVEGRSAREDPDRAARIPDPEAHRSLVVEDPGLRAVAFLRHGRPEVDTRL